MKKLIIFLDIDGVFVSYLRLKEREKDSYHSFSESSVIAMKAIHYHLSKEYEVGYVLSSSWRSGKNEDIMDDIFKLRDIPEVTFKDFTPYSGGGGREIEITKWLTDNYDEWDEFLIFDDETIGMYDYFSQIGYLGYRCILTTNPYRTLDEFDIVSIRRGNIKPLTKEKFDELIST